VDYPLGAHWFSPERILYEIRHITPDFQELELKPRTHVASGIVEMSYTFTGGWKVYRLISGGKELLLRTTMDWTTFKAREYRWVAADGKVVGRSSFAGARPLMSIEVGLERHTQDLLVSCWAALLWSETVAWKKQQSKLDSPI